MASGNFVTYARVSTDRQGKSGLGLDAQRASVEAFLNGGRWKVLGEFVEVESGANCERVQLAEAIKLCRATGSRLLIAKLDRLSRDAHFLLGLEKAGIDFVAADMPEANRLTVGIMAMVAEQERRAISTRTKDALAQAKARGVKLGGNRGQGMTPGATDASIKARQARAAARGTDIAPVLEKLRSEGVTSLGGLAKGLTARGVETSRGGTVWTATQVSRLLSTIAGGS